MSEKVDCAIIGAGVIGLAIARALAEAGREVIVLERNGAIGEETSSRNSEVIHAGLYYPTGSLKARLCVAGKSRLYDYCARKRIPHRNCGKLIVATDPAQADRLKAIEHQARINGVEDCAIIDGDALDAREPSLRGAMALWSPSTGIVDSHALMLALEADLESADGLVALRSEIGALEVRDDAVHLKLVSAGGEERIEARTVVNSAGLDAVRIAANCTGVESYDAPKPYYAKGNYFIYRGPSPFGTLIYPLPVDGGLGIHATLDLAGGLRFGPDVEWTDAIDYSVDPARKEAFARDIRSYWSGLDETRLEPGYAGIRPKLVGPGEPAADFRIDVAASGSRRQLVHLLGMESPGLTAALAIADEVRARIEMAGGNAP